MVHKREGIIAFASLPCLKGKACALIWIEIFLFALYLAVSTWSKTAHERAPQILSGREPVRGLRLRGTYAINCSET